jgi:hypothetical protein
MDRPAFAAIIGFIDWYRPSNIEEDTTERIDCSEKASELRLDECRQWGQNQVRAAKSDGMERIL